MVWKLVRRRSEREGGEGAEVKVKGAGEKGREEGGDEKEAWK